MTMQGHCQECGRVFDLLNEDDASEFAYGHDCETVEETTETTETTETEETVSTDPDDYRISIQQDDSYDDPPTRWGEDNLRVLLFDPRHRVRDDLFAEMSLLHDWNNLYLETADRFPCVCGEDGVPSEHWQEVSTPEDAHTPRAFPMHLDLGGGHATAYLVHEWDEANGAIWFTDPSYADEYFKEDDGRGLIEGDLSLLVQWANGEVYIIGTYRMVECDYGGTHKDYLDGIGGIYSDDDTKPLEETVRTVVEEYDLLPPGVDIAAVDISWE